MNESKVFLGGTCNGSTWRSELKSKLKTKYFDPVVKDWTDKCVAIENVEKDALCDIHLYVITSTQTGVYSIAEAVESVMTRGKKTFFFVVPEGFTEGQLKSLRQVDKIIDRHGGLSGRVGSFHNLAMVIDACAIGGRG